MKKSKALLAVLLATAMVVSVAGCGSSTTTDGSSATSTAESTEAGTEATVSSADTDLNVMIETAVESLDPQQATDGTSFEVIADYTDGLTQMDHDGNAVPAIASSWDISDDGLTYTFHLREDAVWSNGTPVTAKDFVFGWQRAVDPAVASEYAYMLSDIGQIVNAAEIINGEKDKSELGVTAVDDYTLEVKLNVPVSYFTALMYFPTYYPVNEEFFNSVGDAFGTSPETVLSNGAFVLDSYEPAATAFHLTKNANYYDASRVSLTGLNYQVIQEYQTALMSYQNGDLDITLVSGEQVDQVSSDPEFQTVGAGYLWYISPNIAGVPELANENIRLALTMAINREDIVNYTTKDGSIATYTAVPYDFAANFSEDQTKFSDYCRYDTAAAAEYWAKGLEELGETGMSLTLLCDSDEQPMNVAVALEAQLEAALPGLDITVQQEVKKQRVQDMQEGNFELGLTRWGPDYDDPMTYLGMWYTDNSNNYGFWSNAEFDAILDECTTGDLCTKAEERRTRLYDAEELVLKEAAIFPIYTKSNAMMVSSKVTGIDFHPVALNRVYKDTVKAQ